MNKRKDGQDRGKYTLEFKLEAVRLEAHTETLSQICTKVPSETSIDLGHTLTTCFQYGFTA